MFADGSTPLLEHNSSPSQNRASLCILLWVFPFPRVDDLPLLSLDNAFSVSSMAANLTMFSLPFRISMYMYMRASTRLYNHLYADKTSRSHTVYVNGLLLIISVQTGCNVKMGTSTANVSFALSVDLSYRSRRDRILSRRDTPSVDSMILWFSKRSKKIDIT